MTRARTCLQAMKSLRVLAETMGKSITDIMEPHRDVLQDMIPPKKHLLRYQPANVQIGIMVSACACSVCVVLFCRRATGSVCVVLFYRRATCVMLCCGVL